MPLALIISLHFNPGHVSHLRAGYNQMQELGYESWYLVNKDFKDYLPDGSRIIVFGEEKTPASDVAIFFFPSQHNLGLILKLKRRFHTRILYWFHEPLAPLNIYREAGFSYPYLARLWLINRISVLTVKWSDAVLLPSKKAVDLYSANALYANPNYTYMPLIYADERTMQHQEKERRYFSYIGTVASDHSFNEFVAFIKWAYRQEKLKGLQFMIATKSVVECDQQLKEMLSSGRLTLIQGKPMDDDTINDCYASTYVVWNAYARTTQSGVLAKSFMFGTPAIVLKKNLSEFTVDGHEVAAIDDNKSLDKIEQAILRITGNFEHYSYFARKRFEETFYYRRYNKLMGDLLLR